MIAEALAAGPNVLGRRRRALTQAIAAVEEGRGEDEPPKSHRRSPPKGSLAARSRSIMMHVGGGVSSPFELLGPPMSMIVLPYLGPAAAKRELSRPTPKLPPRASRPPGRSTARPRHAPHLSHYARPDGGRPSAWCLQS